MTGKATNRRCVLGALAVLSGLAGGSAGAAFAVRRPLPPDAADAEPVEVSLAGVAPGEMLELKWRGRPVFVRHRTDEEIARERAVPLVRLRDPERDEDRARRAAWVVVEGICTHGGCIPNGPLGDFGGWYCLCHGSQFDTVGRVRSGPARENLRIPPHAFVGELRLRVGVGRE